MMLRPNGRTPISDADLAAVRELAAQGRPIPAIVMAAIVERLEAQALEAAASEERLQPQPA